MAIHRLSIKGSIELFLCGLLFLFAPVVYSRSSSSCGELITYRQYSDLLLKTAPRCFLDGCEVNHPQASISSPCPPSAACHALWSIINTDFQRDWCSSCASDVACRIPGWPILNATSMCEFNPNDWIFYTDGLCCISNDEPFEVAKWIGSMCNGTWREPFEYYGGMARLDWEEWIEPWNWTVRRENTSGSTLPPLSAPECPTPVVKLGLIALENILAALSGLAWKFILYKMQRSAASEVGNGRPPDGGFARMWIRLTRGRLGVPARLRNRRQRRDWPGWPAEPGRKERLWFRLTRGKIGRVDDWLLVILGIGSAAGIIGSNFANAFILKLFPGYENVPGVELAMLWCTRPRMTWLACLLALTTDHGPFADHAASFAVTEVILQCFAAYYIFMSVNVGRQRGFYFVHRLNYFWRGDAAYTMYIGALMWVLAFFLFIAILIFVVFILRDFVIWKEAVEARLAANLRRARELAEQQREDQRTTHSTAVVLGAIILTLTGLEAFFHSGEGDEQQEQRQPLQQTEKVVGEQNNTTRQANNQPGDNQPMQREGRFPLHWRKRSLVAVLLIALFSNIAQWLFWDGFVRSADTR